jgi:FAD linked oxidases, C-terminal domain
MSILRGLKQTFDPDRILNPGKLGLDGGMPAIAPEWMVSPARTVGGKR